MKNSDDWVGYLVTGIFIAPGIGWLITINSNSSTSSDSTSSSSSDYSDYSDAAEPEADTFHGYQCTDDCPDHEAGYQWAEENGVCDDSFDGGNSESFAEGVRAFAEDGCGEEPDPGDDYYN